MKKCNLKKLNLKKCNLKKCNLKKCNLIRLSMTLKFRIISRVSLRMNGKIH
uniref:pentapeptide repeat-containing protein n=1 Tax=Pseudanabaena galeata TaxID=1112103 RepID=UPI00396A7CAE